MIKYSREEVIKKIEAGENFKDADLSGMDLSNVDFRSKEDGGICEKPADLTNCNLTSVNLSKSILINAKLS